MIDSHPLIEAEIIRLRLKIILKDLNERLSAPQKSSGITSYDDRVAFSAGIYYASFKNALEIQTDVNQKFVDNTDKALDWLKWLDDEKVNAHDVWTYVFENMDVEELKTWQNRFTELINEPSTEDYLTEWLKVTYDISVGVQNKLNIG